MTVMVTGGAGYIGSVVVEALLSRGQQVVVYDNLAKGHRDAVAPAATFVAGDIADAARLRETFGEYHVRAVVHMAAESLVGESVSDPAKYYRTNVQGGLTLLDAMRDSGVTQLVFSSTAAVYGEPQKQPIEETDTLAPTNPYGATKLAFEGALRWFAGAYGLRYASLRYFNAAGASRRCGEQHDPETHLIPLVLQAAAGLRPAITVFGNDYPTPDGTCVRDYIHVEDLAEAHVLALEAIAAGQIHSEVYNLGCGDRGYSVLDVIGAAERVTRRPVTMDMGARRPGDPAVLIASSEKIAQSLGWHPKQNDLETIVGSAWRWMQQQPAR